MRIEELPHEFQCSEASSTTNLPWSTAPLSCRPSRPAGIADGRIRYREDITGGLENAPAAFIGMLEGRNFGKALVRVAENWVYASSPSN